MQRFFERIRKKALDVGQPPLLIAALGDSVTQGAMEHGVFAPAAVYHRLVQTELETFFPTTTFSTINAGVSGGDVTQALARLERDVIRHQPDLVTIAFGLNDSLGGIAKLDAFGEALGELVTRIRAGTQAAVILLTPPFMATRVSHRVHPIHADFAENIIRTQQDGMLTAHAEKVREVARRHATPLADIHAGWTRLAATGLDPDLWLSNGLNHPDARGHRLIAQILFQTILSNFQPHEFNS